MTNTTADIFANVIESLLYLYIRTSLHKINIFIIIKIVWGATSDGKVILKLIRFGKKGELDDEDCFTLEKSGVPKILAANSESSLEIKGYISN